MGKLITFREEKCLIKMYVSAAVVPRLPNVSKRPATTPISTKTAATAPKQAKPALSLLGAYSDSESDSD